MNLVKKIIKFFLKPFKKMYINISSTCRLKKAQKFKNDGPIVFLCQCEYIWNKTRDVFLETVKSGKKVILYVVKDALSVSKKNITIFEEEFSKYVIKYEDARLEALEPSIVIYSRPYNHHLPKELRIHNVIKYAKTAYIPYYYSLDNLVESGINDVFYKYLMLLFADQEDVKNHFDRKQAKNIRRGLQASYNIGYPVLDNLYENVNTDSIYKNSEKYKVMWTPRWTMDKKLGGSNFLNYYKGMFEKFVNNEEVSFVFRPHPLLFSNFIEKKIITQAEKDQIVEMFNTSSNSFYDTTSDYINTFYNTDLLICDNSSIIVEYFLLGKPMIFCYNDSNVVFTNVMNKILECNYVVNSFDEMMAVYEQLKNGIDEKAIKRSLYLKEFNEINKDSAKRIANKIIEF